MIIIIIIIMIRKVPKVEVASVVISCLAATASVKNHIRDSSHVLFNVFKCFKYSFLFSALNIVSCLIR